MQHERVERVKFLLASALAKPPDERNAYLDAACAGDLGLRRDVDHYLSSGEKTERFVFQAESSYFTDPSVETPADPRIGKEFGKYVIRKRVAEGGMGIVYLAIDTQLGREVALKILPEYFSMDRERLQRFQREARATSLLNHPNIVTVFEIGQLDGCEFIVSEFVEGQTLREKMTQGPIPFVEILKVASQVAGALGAAHKAGIIHRDIKPENVMVRPDGYVKVLDFGLAKLTGATMRTLSGDLDISQHGFGRTIPGMIMGTAAYMSPEQAEGLDIDSRTDIWALGVLLYEMAAGKLPFEGPTPSHTIVAILEQEPQPFEHASAELCQIISTALQKDKQLRFQTAEAMSSALDDLRHRLGYVSDQNIAGPSIADRKSAVYRTKPYRKLVWLIPTAFAALLVGTFAAYAVIMLLFNSYPAASNTPVANRVLPIPTGTMEATSATPVPTMAPVYVDPTPAPTPGVTDQNLTNRAQKNSDVAAERPKPTPMPTPARTPKTVEAKKSQTKKPKPTQDPNCVFTNSCQ